MITGPYPPEIFIGWAGCSNTHVIYVDIESVRLLPLASELFSESLFHWFCWLNRNSIKSAAQIIIMN